MSESIPSLPATIETDHPHEVWIIQPPQRRLWLHIVLLLATFVTTMAVGSRIQSNFDRRQPTFSLSDDSPFFPVDWISHPSELLSGLSFSLTLMFILLAHEMGHYLYARHYRVYATLPYFVPFPSLIGTLGAFIRIKTPIPSRAALFDIGIAGPIAGFIPASIAMFVGLSLSQPTIPHDPSFLQLGFPLGFHLAGRILHLASPLSSLSLHPVAAAAWVGMFATALNLLPGGQLDGGHIIFSISPPIHRVVSLFTVLALIPMGKYFWTGWFLWSVLLAMTMRHPPVRHEPAITGLRRWIALFGALMLVLSFTPAPFTHSSGREIWPEIRGGAADTMRSLQQDVRHWRHRR